MSELEDRWFWAYPTESVDCDGITGSANEVYSKSDIDKVIAEKGKQLRHHKHKRCLAMAQVLEHVCPITNRKAKWQDKWHKRWLELAEKFKEAK